MTSKNDQMKISEEQQALDAIEQMQHSALRQGLPPRWFGATIALLTGAMVTFSAAGLNQYNVLIILFMAIVLVYQSQKASVTLRTFPSKLVGIVVIILMVALFFLLIIAAQMLSDRFGFVWAPLMAGILFGLVVFALSVSERHEVNSKVSREKVNE
jgi:hypothetical protein